MRLGRSSLAAFLACTTTAIALGCAPSGSSPSTSDELACLDYPNDGIEKIVWAADGASLMVVTRDPFADDPVVRILDGETLQETDRWSTSSVDAVDLAFGDEGRVYRITNTGDITERGAGVDERVVAHLPDARMSQVVWTPRGLLGESWNGGTTVEPGEIALFDFAGDQSWTAVYRPTEVVESLVAQIDGEIVVVRELDPPESPGNESFVTIIDGQRVVDTWPVPRGLTLVSMGTHGASALGISSDTGQLLRLHLDDGATERIADDVAAASESTTGLLAIGFGRGRSASQLCIR